MGGLDLLRSTSRRALSKTRSHTHAEIAPNAVAAAKTPDSVEDVAEVVRDKVRFRAWVFLGAKACRCENRPNAPLSHAKYVAMHVVVDEDCAVSCSPNHR
jgi:hypothetical protein